MTILQEAIPGCEEVAKESYNEFTGAVVAKVGPIKSRFVGTASLENVLPPESYTIVGEGKGGPAGTVKVTARVELIEKDSATIVSYKVDAKIAGKLAQLGGPIVEKTAEKLSKTFFSNLQNILNEKSGITGPSNLVQQNNLLVDKRFYVLITIALATVAAYLVI